MTDPKRPFGSHLRPTPAQAAAVERWSLPEVGGGRIIGRDAREEKKTATVDTVEVLRQALLESEAKGYQAGLAKAQAETQVTLDALAARVTQLDSILQFLAQPLAQLDAEV